MRTILTDATRLTIEQEDGITLDWKRQSDESLAQWYWRSFQLMADNLGFDDCIQPNPRMLDQVASTKAEPKEIPFGPHLTCSQCQGACTDHYSVSNNIWCPECSEGRIQPTGQHPSWLPTPQEVDQYMPPERRDYLHGKRAKLLERIQELVDQRSTYPEQSLAGLILADLRDELAAVESELGYPEAQEPEEA